MARKAVTAALALVLVLFGWVVGRSQASQPDFEFTVDAPSGETTVQCVRGCELLWLNEDQLQLQAATKSLFTHVALYGADLAGSGDGLHGEARLFAGPSGR
jgi:hypothetical protein